MFYALRAVALTLVLFVVYQPCSSGQTVNRSFEEEVDFIHHLERSDFRDDAIFQLHRLNARPGLNSLQRDSVHFLLGWNYYEGKQLDSSIHFFQQVPPGHSQYLKAHFFTGYNQLYQGNYGAARTQFGQLQDLDRAPHFGALQRFELAGVALLDSDFDQFDSLSKGFDGKYYQFAREEEDLREIAESMRKLKRRSPWIAGGLSAVVPGTGKMYAGKVKEGLVAMFQVVALGGVAYEQYRRYGIEDLRTIAFGGIFSVFYIGNIWGSAVTVKIKYDENRYDLENRLLLDLHIPLRTVFN